MKNENEETAGQGQEFIEISKMYVSLRYNDYALENGMGELVDNSIESGAQHVYVTFEKKKVKEGKKNIEVIDRIVVADDGCGMNKEVLGKCLVLGCSVREKRNGLAGIGKFGVGMTLGGISLARRIEVYSRMKETEDFLYTFIDLDMITKKEILKIPTPSVSEPPQPYKEMIGNSTGTIVVLSKCDRVGAAGKKQDAGELYASMANYLGRTYRKFIEAGKKIILDGKQVYLHDPLYMSGPTQFDTEGKTTRRRNYIARQQ